MAVKKVAVVVLLVLVAGFLISSPSPVSAVRGIEVVDKHLNGAVEEKHCYPGCEAQDECNTFCLDRGNDRGECDAGNANCCCYIHD